MKKEKKEFLKSGSIIVAVEHDEEWWRPQAGVRFCNCNSEKRNEKKKKKKRNLPWGWSMCNSRGQRQGGDEGGVERGDTWYCTVQNVCCTLLARCYVQSSPSLVTAVEKILLDTIKANRLVSYTTYMQHCLSHPMEGYYMNPKNAISQAFGELLGIWLLSQYLCTGVKHDIQLVELGPGKGTLVDDILQNSTDFVTIAPISCFHQTHPPCGVKSVPLCCTAEETRWDGKNGLRIHWHDLIDDVPAANGIYTMLVAHEFFDALPFHLIEPSPLASATPSLDLSASTPRTCFRPDLAAEPTPVSTLLGTSSPRFASLPIGTRIEVSATSFQTARKLGTLVSQGVGGSILVIDYRADHTVGNSFCAFKGHALVDPFDRPGQADLTANVDQLATS
ncbi:S-adenosyl-L-methionine-dependent methyltransferase [Lactarius deliciosus]|nr:S-adenosyl-L-methionine-dependent methyltransferase [Lactarius deliciosus]